MLESWRDVIQFSSELGAKSASRQDYLQRLALYLTEGLGYLYPVGEKKEGSYNITQIMEIQHFTYLYEVLWYLGPQKDKVKSQRLLKLFEKKMAKWIKVSEEILVEGASEFRDDWDFWTRFGLNILLHSSGYKVYIEPDCVAHKQTIDLVTQLYQAYQDGSKSLLRKAAHQLLDSHPPAEWRSFLHNLKHFPFCGE